VIGRPRLTGTQMAAGDRTPRPARIRALMATLFRTSPSTLGTDVAVVPVRIALVWIFTYYGAGKLFGWFNGPGIHRTAIFFSTTAHLHPGGLFAIIGGIIEFGAAVALAIGLVSRLAALALFGDQVVAMITVSWVHGINSLSATPGYEFNLVLAASSLVIVGLGAGRLSLDAIVGRHVRPGRPVRGGPGVEEPAAAHGEPLRPGADRLAR
jgi:putative oxidoreductase